MAKDAAAVSKDDYSQPLPYYPKHKPTPLHERCVNVRCNACDRSLVGGPCPDTTCAKHGLACGLITVRELQDALRKLHESKAK